MSIDSELERLKALSRDENVTVEQRRTARKARDALLDDAILAAWGEIEACGAELDSLVARLSAIVDNISANQLTTAIDDISGVLADVKTAAEAASGGNS